MVPIVASPADVERLLRLYNVATMTELVAQIAEWDHADAFLDTGGRLCLPDSPPAGAQRISVGGTELQKLLDHYGVESGDIECLRRRMIFEGAWNPEEVSVEGGRIFVAAEHESE